ncbi:MAG TPA: helix-turn-helix domain-containing protein [Puia sp.]|nr:helix-turn-helix domain-containing protein [Puia sp.]
MLTKLGIPHGPVELGEVELLSEIFTIQLEQIKIELLSAGFELLEDHKSILIEKIKTIIVEMVHVEYNLPKTNFSAYLTRKLPYDYTYLANIFSEVKGTTIERFIIMHKIERIKELLLYNELSLTEISYKLNYSSVAHLSAQFKKITGLTPTDFKKQKDKSRNELEDL